MKTNWQTTRLGAVARISAGNSAPQKKEFFIDGKYPFFRTSDIGEVHIGKISKTADYLNERGIKGLKLFNKGTLLLPKSGASTFLNHRVIMDIDGYVSSHLAAISTKEEVLNSEFLFYFLQNIKIQDLLQDHKYPSLNLPTIENIEIPLPSLPEQKQIAQTLNDAFEKLKKAKENTEKNLQLSKEFFEACLESALDSNKQSNVCTLMDIAMFRNGINFTKNGKGPSVKIVGVKDFQNNFFVPFETLDSVTLNCKLNEEDLLKDGDILVVRSNGNPRLIGRSLLVEDIRGPITHSGFTIRIRLSSKDIDPKFLCYYLKSRKTRRELTESGIGINIKSLSQESLKALNIEIPGSLSEQRKIVKKLDQLSENTKKLESHYKHKLESIEELKKSILSKAFSKGL